MDPNLVIQSLATIVGLLCNFRQEQGSQHQLGHRDFLDWLEYHRHEEIKNLITNCQGLPREIDNLLLKDSQEILQRLKSLDEVLATILSRVDGFSGLVNVLAPGMELSQQARDFLKLLAENEASALLFLPDAGSGIPVLCLSPGGGIPIPESRFIEDDINTLVAYGFFTHQPMSHGGSLLKLTRSGERYAMLLKAEAAKP